MTPNAKNLRDRSVNDPVFFFENVLGITTLEEYQKKMIETIWANERTAISACHDVGKSWTLARITLAFTSIFPYSKVITTAPTFNQVKNILWSEIRSAYARSKVPLGGTMLQTEWQVSEHGDWFAMGFTSRNEASSGEGQGTQSTFQGFHAPYILVIFDEATGIPPNIWTMAEGLLTSANVKFVCIGNPTSRNSPFFKCFSSPVWSKVKLSCFDSPNLIANGIRDLDKLKDELRILRELPEAERLERLKSYKVVRPWLLTTSWVMAKALEWGLTHPLFVSKVLGEFPSEGDKVVIPLGVVEQAQARHWDTQDQVRQGKRTLGVDVARYGTDSTVLTYLHGLRFITKKELAQRNTTEVVGEIMHLCQTEGWPDVITVDATGLGAGVFDLLIQNQFEGLIPSEVQIVEVHFGGSCSDDVDRQRFANIKAKMFDLLGKDLREGLTLTGDDVYLDELPTIEYFFDSKGRLRIESKDEYKARLGRKSPDHADSLALANYGRYVVAESGSFTSWVSEGAGGTLAGGLNDRV